MKKTNLAKIFFTLLIILFSKKVHAAVSFSEIAWMGGQNSSADEWIELYNDGENMSLEGYVIESQSKKLSILLSGSISKNSYYLIERTDDDSVPNISADLVASFGTGLNNAGDTIYLKDQNGNFIDSLLFSNGWPAGDNGTKETMQKVSNSWVTAVATPKSGSNVSPNTDTETESTQQTTTSASGGGATNKPKANLSNFEIRATSDPFTLLPIRFKIIDVDENGSPIIYNYYKVNFGDGNEKSFKYNDSIEHTYQYPGFYKVTVKQFVSSWSISPKNQESLILHIEDAQISIDSSKAPILIIKNISNKDIDLAQFTFYSGQKIFKLPEGSIVFAGKDLWLSPQVTGFSKDEVLVANIMSESGFNIYNQLPITPVKLVTSSKPSTKTSTIKSLNVEQDSSFNIFPENTELLAQVSTSGIFRSEKENKTFVWVLFGVLIIGGSILFLKIRNKEIPESEEFTLLEE